MCRCVAICTKPSTDTFPSAKVELDNRRWRSGASMSRSSLSRGNSSKLAQNRLLISAGQQRLNFTRQLLRVVSPAEPLSHPPTRPPPAPSTHQRKYSPHPTHPPTDPT